MNIARPIDTMTGLMSFRRSNYLKPHKPTSGQMLEAVWKVFVSCGKTRAAERTRRSDRENDKNGRMGLGARTSREARERPSRDSDWMRRALAQPN